MEKFIVSQNIIRAAMGCCGCVMLIWTSSAEDVSFSKPNLGYFSTFNKGAYLKKNFELMADSKLNRLYGAPLRFFINGDPKESCGNFGGMFSMPLIGSKVTKVDSNMVAVSLPGGREVEMRRVKGDEEKYKSIIGGWSGVRIKNRFILKSYNGEVITFKKGRVSSILTSNGDEIGYQHSQRGTILKDLKTKLILLGVQRNQLGLVEELKVDGKVIKFNYGFYADQVTPKLLNIAYGSRMIDLSSSDLMKKNISYVDKFSGYVVSSDNYTFGKDWKLIKSALYKYSYIGDSIKKTDLKGFWEDYSVSTQSGNSIYRNSTGFLDEKIYTLLPNGQRKLRKRITGNEGARKTIRKYWDKEGELLKNENYK